EYEQLIGRLQYNLGRLSTGLTRMGLAVLGGGAPILSVLVGDEEHTLNAGNFLFEHGYYVQSVTLPAGPYPPGVPTIQVNPNHLPEPINGLLDAMAQLRKVIPLRGPEALPPLAA